MRLLLLVLASSSSSSSILEVYTGDAGPRSSLYAASLGGVAATPHVYATQSPDADLEQIHAGIFCTLHGAWFCNRTVSWLDVGADAGAEVRVEIRLLPPLYLTPHDAASVRLAPRTTIARNLTVDVARSAIRFTLTATSRAQHVALSWGARRAAEAGRRAARSSYAHAFYLFLGARDPAPPSAAALANGSAVLFTAGRHFLNTTSSDACSADGVLQLPPTVAVVHLARGAWLEGRFNVTAGGEETLRTVPLNVVGHGVMSGARYAWHGGGVADALRMVEPAWGVPLHIEGMTIVDSRGHALILPPRSHAVDVRIIGWLFNEDGVWITSHSTLRDAFVRTNDDAVRVYAGAVDHWDPHKPPPPRDGRPATHVLVDGLVAHQLFNGAVLQLGWEDAGTAHCVARDVVVLAAEWYDRGAATGDNNAVLSLQSPQYDLAMVETHRNFTLERVVVERPVGRFVTIALRGAAPRGAGCSTFNGLAVRSAVLSEPMAWFATNLSAPTSSPGGSSGSRLVALGCDVIENVRFADITLAGVRVDGDAVWGLVRDGNVSSVSYA